MTQTPPLQSLIGSRILTLRDQRVMLDADLAELYEVPTKALIQAVKRNLARFPMDFMFQLSIEEFAILRSQTVTSSGGHGGRRTPPYVFTEQGVAMLSSVLGSQRAVAVNIEIMRTFVRLRALIATHADLAARLVELEERADALAAAHDAFSRDTRTQLKQVFEVLRALTMPPDPPKRPIGFVVPKEPQAPDAAQSASAG